MKRNKILSRVLSLLMIFVLFLTSLGLSEIEVKADRWGTAEGGIVGAGTVGNTKGHNAQAVFGYRLYLVEQGFKQGEDPNKDGTIFTSAKDYLHTGFQKKYCITIYDSEHLQNWSNIYNYSIANDTYYDANVVSDINEIFSGLHNSDGLYFETRGSDDFKIYSELSVDFWNGAFKDYVCRDTDSKARALEEFRVASGCDGELSPDCDYCFVVEPVIIYKATDDFSSNTLKYADIDCFIVGWLDITDMYGQYNTPVMMEKCKTWRHDTATYLKGYHDVVSTEGMAFKFLSSFTANGTEIDEYSISRNIESMDFLHNGYAAFGCDVWMDTGFEAKAGATYTVFYEGSAVQSNKGTSVWAGTNIVDKENSGTIHYNFSDVLPSNAGDIILESWGNRLRNPFASEKPASHGESVSESLTDLYDSEWSSNYYNVTAGVKTIDFSDIENGSTQDIVSSVNNLKSTIKNFKFTPSATSISNYNVNLGSTYKLKIENASADNIVEGVADKLAKSSYVYKNNTPKNVTAGRQYRGNIKNIATNFALEAIDNSNGLQDVSEDSYKAEDAKLGVSVSVMAKKQDVNSYIAYATLNRDTDTITYDSNDSRTYDVSSSGSFTNTSDDLCMYVAVRNNGGYSLANDRTGNTIFSQCKVSTITNENSLRSIMAGKSTGIISSGYISRGQTIGVGCESDGSGYSILILRLTEAPAKESNIDLKDYELNYVHPTMLVSQKFSGLLSTDSYKVTGTNVLGSGTHNEVVNLSVNGNSDKKVVATNNYAGNIIDKNKLLGTNKNILQYDQITGGIFTTEANARNGYVFNSNLSNVKFSLAVNLTRSSFGDKRVVSSISNQAISGNMDYIQNNLDMISGNKPSSSVLNATSIRNSDATVGGGKKDIFEWQVFYNYTNTLGRYALVKDVKNNCTDFYNKCSPQSYTKAVSSNFPASFDGKKVTYNVSEKAYKYQTDTLDTAVNTIKQVADSSQVATNGINNTNSVLPTLYKTAVVNTSNKTLSFYPEVAMRAYVTTGDKIASSIMTVTGEDRSQGGGVSWYNVLTMGEVKRTLKPSSLYLVKVTDPSGVAISGTTLSDSVAVGSNASNISGGLPVVYAGGDISLNVNSNFRLNMYSYSLDLIETSDTDIKGVGNYSSVVADNSPVKTDWGNDDSYKPLNDFNDWIKDALSKLAVDTTLTVKGDGVDKVYNNFSTSIGDLGDISASADGVFNIKIKEGTIVEDSGYQALLNQIKADYSLNNLDEARVVFENSDIYQSIARAVEDSNDSFNNSMKSGAINFYRDHWYDEEVKTFVIRRFKKENIEIKNVLVNDKIDYGAAPTADKSVAGNKGYKKATAKWYMTLYFKDLPTGFASSTPLYNPANYNSLSAATSAGTVLVSETYINGADFVVPSASTNEMGNN